jgi:hypothetical protein
LPKAGRCRNYHFEFKDAGDGLWRYPENGELLTFGEGNCESDYTAKVTGTAPGHSPSSNKAIGIKKTLIKHGKIEIIFNGNASNNAVEFGIYHLNGRLCYRSVKPARSSDEIRWIITTPIGLEAGLYYFKLRIGNEIIVLKRAWLAGL